MNLKDAMYERHSVRAYEDRPIDAELLEELEALIRDCNEESGLHIQLVTNEPKAFQSLMARYGQFKGVTNYIAMVGPKSSSLDELCGYYGEKIVLRAQMMGCSFLGLFRSSFRRQQRCGLSLKSTEHKVHPCADTGRFIQVVVLVCFTIAADRQHAHTISERHPGIGLRPANRSFRAGKFPYVSGGFIQITNTLGSLRRYGTEALKGHLVQITNHCPSLRTKK